MVDLFGAERARTRNATITPMCQSERGEAVGAVCRRKSAPHIAMCNIVTLVHLLSQHNKHTRKKKGVRNPQKVITPDTTLWLRENTLPKNLY